MSKEYNVQLITLDSCRFDTAVAANTPNLDGIAKMQKAETDATYTYPSHHSMFIGILPRILDPNDHRYMNRFDQIWRARGARPTDKNVFEDFTERNVIEHYERIGHNVQGFGGVHFFNPNLNCTGLSDVFTSFEYFGIKDYIPEYDALPRNESQLPLGNVDHIAERVSTDRPYFLFINSPETHNPYDSPDQDLGDDYRDLIIRLNKEHASKKSHRQDELPFAAEEIQRLKQAQITALEWVDSQLGRLFKAIKSKFPTLTIVTADHGEEFGEEGRFGHAHNAQTVREVPIWIGIQE